jgi:uncharacterized protein YifN (PemK superfamily)
MLLNSFHPKQGHFLICDFDRGFVTPEIVKIRPVIVISKSDTHHNGRKLCTVVAISTAAPNPIHHWHFKLPANINPLSNTPSWVKCDMIYTVSYERLNKPHKKTNKGREYLSIRISDQNLKTILACVQNYLGF